MHAWDWNVEENRVAQYHPIDIRVAGRCLIDNPFAAELHGRFVGPGGRRLTVPGFFDGEGTWAVRFSPPALGKWTFSVQSPHIEFTGGQGEAARLVSLPKPADHNEAALPKPADQDVAPTPFVPAGTLRCVVNDNPRIHGGLKVDRQYHFRFEDGTPHFMMGYEANWLWALGFGDSELSRLKQFLDGIRPYCFNQIFMNVYAHDTRWRKGKTRDDDYGPPAQYLWEGTNQSPDHRRMNLDYFRNFDRVMGLLMQEGFIAHLYFKVYNKFVNWPEKVSFEDDLYFKYVTARYQAFPNVIWDFAKESRKEPDKAYVLNRVQLIRSCDAYRRLITVHDDLLFYADRAGRGAVDFYTEQGHYDWYTAGLLNRLQYGCPIVNAEFGYEHGPGGLDDVENDRGHTPEVMIDRACQIVMSGAYFVYYYTYTAFDVIDLSHVPPGYVYFQRLYDFFASLEWSDFEPHPECVVGGRPYRCMARPGEEYVFYLEGGAAQYVLSLTELPAEESYGAVWIEWVSDRKVPGEWVETDFTSGEPSLYAIRTPFPDRPALLHVRKHRKMNKSLPV